jgi:hypothetical protein
MTPAYPLQWPDGMPRTKIRVTSQFKVTLAAAIDNVQSSLRRFGRDSAMPITNVVISSNYSLGVTIPADPGVAVFFEWDGAQRCIAVDRYQKLADNLQAIHKVLEARRVEVRHGGISIVRQTFRGFLALPNPDATDWRKLFGFRVDQVVTPAMIDAAYKDLAALKHPDRGTTPDERDALTREMATINLARDTAKTEVGS